MESIKSRPVDFVGHAASWSLSCYVIEEYDKQKNSMDENYVTYLLCCSMWAFSHGCPTESLMKSLDLVANLLSRGGNPNLYIRDFAATIWGHFIRIAPWGQKHVREKLVMTTKTFVEKGADIHMTLLSDKIFFWRLPEGQAPVAAQSLRIILSRELSILRYLQSHEGQSDVVEVLLAKGAQIYSKYKHISANLQNNGLSKKQLDKWLAALNAGHLECTHDCETVRKWWIVAGQVRKYYEENLGNDEDSDIQINWEVGDDHDINLESCFMLEQIYFQVKADLQESRPIDG